MLHGRKLYTAHLYSEQKPVLTVSFITTKFKKKMSVFTSQHSIFKNFTSPGSHFCCVSVCSSRNMLGNNWTSVRLPSPEVLTLGLTTGWTAVTNGAAWRLLVDWPLDVELNTLAPSGGVWVLEAGPTVPTCGINTALCCSGEGLEIWSCGWSGWRHDKAPGGKRGLVTTWCAAKEVDCIPKAVEEARDCKPMCPDGIELRAGLMLACSIVFRKVSCCWIRVAIWMLAATSCDRVMSPLAVMPCKAGPGMLTVWFVGGCTMSGDTTFVLMAAGEDSKVFCGWRKN